MSADAVATCTEPTVFAISEGGIDLVSLPETPGATVMLGSATSAPQPTDAGTGSAIGDTLRAFLTENTNFKFAAEERAGITEVSSPAYDNFGGPGVPPSLDVSAVAINEIFVGHGDFGPPTLGEAPQGFADSLFGETYQFSADQSLGIDPTQVDGLLLDVYDVTPDGYMRLQQYSTGMSGSLPPPGDLLVVSSLTLTAVPGDQQPLLIDLAEGILATGQPRQAGWATNPLFGSGGSLACGPHDSYVVLCDPTDPGGGQFAGGFGIYAMGFAGPLDAMGPPYEVEAPTVLVDPSGEVYMGSFEGDFFNGGNHAFVARSIDGEPPTFGHQQYDGSSWGPAPTASRLVVAPNATVLIHDHGFHPAAVRFNTFKAGGQRAPGFVGSYSFPEMTGSPLSTDGALRISAEPPAPTPFAGSLIDLVERPTTVEPPAPTTTTTTLSPSTPGVAISTGDDGGGGGGPTIPLILVGLALAGGGGYLYVKQQRKPAIATATPVAAGPAAVTPTDTTWSEVITGETPVATEIPGVTTGERPPKGEGGDADDPPTIGIRGWKL